MGTNWRSASHFSNANTATTTFDALSVTTNTDLTFKLTVTDNGGIIDDKEAVSIEADTVQITIQDLGANPGTIGYWKEHPTETSSVLKKAKDARNPIKLGTFKVPTTYDLAKTIKDAKGILMLPHLLMHTTS